MKSGPKKRTNSLSLRVFLLNRNQTNSDVTRQKIFVFLNQKEIIKKVLVNVNEIELFLKKI